MAAAKAALSELVSRAAAGDRFRLLRRGKAVAALVSTDDLEALEARGRVQSFLAALEAFRARNHEDLPERALDVRRSRGRAVR